MKKLEQDTQRIAVAEVILTDQDMGEETPQPIATNGGRGRG